MFPIRSSFAGQAEALFQPYHVFLKASSVDQLADSDIQDKIGFSSGTKLHQTDKASSGLLTTDSRAMGVDSSALAARPETVVCWT